VPAEAAHQNHFHLHFHRFFSIKNKIHRVITAYVIVFFGLKFLAAHRMQLLMVRVQFWVESSVIFIGVYVFTRGLTFDIRVIRIRLFLLYYPGGLPPIFEFG
jgi:uncharacterized membrane protein